MATFQEQLAFGKKLEERLMTFLRSRNEEPEMAPSGFFDAYDVRSNGVTYECKRDRLAWKNGCLCVEVTSAGRPSGISVSKADYYVIEAVGVGVFMIPTPMLKSLINCSGKRPRKCCGGKNECHFLPLYYFEPCLESGI